MKKLNTKTQRHKESNNIFKLKSFSVSSCLCVFVFNFIIILFSSGCSKQSQHCEYVCWEQPQSDCFIIFLVNAPHIDYSNNRALLRSLSKHPRDGSKNGDVGHAWVYLQGTYEGQYVFLEGGHSGERGRIQPRYFEGVVNNLEYGYPNPNEQQKLCPRFEPNPINYLWEIQHDGFFQLGSGNHKPTYAAKVYLSPQQFASIIKFIKNYPFSDYSLQGNQCSSFVAQIGTLIGFPIESEVQVEIEPSMQLHEGVLRLWEDPCYRLLTIPCPDVIEQSLMRSVCEGKAEYVLPEYLERHQVPLRQRMRNLFDCVVNFPSRIGRVYLFRE